VVSGDIILPSLGLSEADQEHVRATSTTFIHAASSLSLGARLASIASAVIEGSLETAKLALSCPGLERFVYISTAYANGHLHQQHEIIETRVEGNIYSLLPSNDLLDADPEEEYINIKLHGTNEKFQLSDFPWVYAYAKYLTGRLLLRIFQDGQISGLGKDTEPSSFPSKFLIIRPSVIGPSQTWSYKNFDISGPVPTLTLAAAIIAEPSLEIICASRLDDPLTEATTNEIPVDMAVNIILMHLAYESHGIVNAVAPKGQLVSGGDFILG
jgi:fatty acyl-CoA reductase